ncbi:MAG: penicillin-binding transpeptidase domain-containing protein [Pseudobdellovibrionaceae bacterium]
MKAICFFAIAFFVLGFVIIAQAKVDFKKVFGERDGCFLISDLQTGKVLAEYNQTRCKERFSPCSTFKIPAALMAFEKGIFKDENHLIPWDHVKRDREELNKDQTPFTFMSNSAKWVTEWILPQIGKTQIQSFLKSFQYGNQDFSGGLQNAWVSSSLKISAHEQVAFLSNFWNQKLGLSNRTTDLTKKIIFIKKFGEKAELYGKTGTGCLDGNQCFSQPGPMLGWFVGILKTDSKQYVFAGNAADLKPQKSPAGPRMRETVIEILKGMKLTSE